MLPEKIFLIDLGLELVQAWNESFSNDDIVSSHQADYFSIEADAMVSPANSFGIMDGGLDLAIRNELGFETEARLQNEIVKCFHGELPIGMALVVKTDSKQWPYMVSAPTMRVPQDVSTTLNAYLSFRAVLLAIKNFNESIGKHKIKSIVCSGLATGIGNMSPKRCAQQMKFAYQCLYNPAKIPGAQQIWAAHKELEETGN